MTNPVESNLANRLQRLWKGTLVVAITASYVLLLAWLLVNSGWREALMALLLIAFALFLRYIANDVDRIGWHLSKQASEGEADEATSHNQKHMYRLLVTLTQFPNLALIGYGYLLGGWRWAAGIAAVLIVIEYFCMRVRKVNRSVAFAQASYGFAESGLLTAGPDSIRGLAETREAELQRKLEALERLEEDGLISRKAYEKARDKLRIRHVMESDRPLRAH